MNQDPLVDFKLTAHFGFFEMTASGRHPDLVAANRAWALDEAYPGRLQALVSIATMLESIRVHFGKPGSIHSGARFPTLNRAVGGQPSSQHMKCEAADFHVQGVDLKIAWKWIWAESGLAYGQCLLEGTHGHEPSWIHLSLGEPWRPRSRCREYLRIDASTNKRITSS